MAIIKLALSNLLRRRARTLLTILGVTVAIAFTTGLLSVSEGFIVITDQALSRQKEHILVLPKETAGNPMPMIEAYGTSFPQKIADEIAKIDNVKRVYPVYVQTQMTSKKMTSYFSLNGVTADFLPELRPHLAIEDGRLFEDGERNVVVLGSVVAKEQNLKQGGKLKIKDKDIEVIGLLKSSGGMLGFEDMVAYLPMTTLQEIYGQKEQVTFLAVTVDDVAKAKNTAQEITDSLTEVAAQTSEDIVGLLKDWIGTARAIHFIIASFALLIGVLFVLSTMMMSVSERAKEIGTLRAIGAGRKFIFQLILTESIIIALLAGVIGCILGYLLSLSITQIAAKFLEFTFIQTQVTPRILGLGMGTALLIGTLAGLYPAYRISKTNIVKALKYE